MAESLRRQLLQLLREDEEFRYAVVGLLGLEDIRKTLGELVRAIERLTTAYEKLAERVDLLEASHERLVKRVEELAAAQVSLARRVEELAERVNLLEASHERLVKRVEELAAAQVRLEEKMAELADVVRNLSKEVGRLGDIVGFGLEDVARVVVPGWLYRHEGVEAEDLVRKFFVVEGEEVEVNLYGEGLREGRKVYILGEAKSRIYGDDVWRFYSSASKVAKLLKDGDVYLLMFGFYVHPTAEKAAEKLGVKLIASYMR